jgi:hypothetical protein
MFEIGHIIFILWFCPACCWRDVGFSILNPKATTLLATKEASLFFLIEFVFSPTVFVVVGIIVAVLNIVVVVVVIIIISAKQKVMIAT